MVSEQNFDAEDHLRVDRTVLTVTDDFTDRETTLWWHAQSPEARLRHMMLLRRLNYGDRAAAGLQRVLEVAERAPR